MQSFARQESDVGNGQMTTMKAAVVSDAGVEIREVPKPEAGPSQVLVRVRASGLNRADLIMASGRMHGSHGGAEYAVADWGRVSRIPANNMSFTQAATLPIALQTMHDALVTNGRFVAGDSVLIQGARSGVGLMGLQIAKLRGARLVIGSSTNAGRRARLAEFGADLAIDSSDTGWADQVIKATGGKGVDLIVDQISASVANANMKAAAVRGRIVNVGRLGGFEGPFDFDLHAMKRIDYIGDQPPHAGRSVGRRRSRQARAADRPHVPAGRGRGRTRAHEGQRPLRQDRVDPVRPPPTRSYRPFPAGYTVTTVE
jgi:NADPH:quinone reductase